jgi:hypothetical protein
MKGNIQRERLLVRAARRIDDGAPVTRVCRDLGVTERELAAWRWNRSPGALTLAKRLVDLEWENRQLRVAVNDLRCHRKLLLEAFNIVFPATNADTDPAEKLETKSSSRKGADVHRRSRAWVM